MALRVVGETKRKLEHVPQRLRDEFPEIDPAEVVEETAEIAEALLEQARFPDYVPLLTYRYAREHLTSATS